jgi:hypothetical protein
MIRSFALHLAAALASAIVMTVALIGNVESHAPWAGDDAPALAQSHALETRTTAIGQERAASA